MTAQRVVMVVDMQNGVFATPRLARERCVAQINRLVRAADKVIFIQHDEAGGLEAGSEGFALLPELEQPAGALYVTKTASGLVISLFFTTLVIQLCNGSIGPILALFIKSMAPDSNNIAFLAGMIAAVPGVSALISAPRLGKLGDRIGTSRILLATLCCAVVMFFAMSFVTTPLQLGTLRFLLGFADGAMLPAVQTLLLKYSSDSVTGRIFGYNQSFMYLGNVAGPLIGASVSAMAGFRWVFIATAIIVFINLWQLAWMLRQTRRANA
ncbi:multidrug-efflux transporter [Klebsiella pneumoniae]|nr:multidrug-efflux transporter [Klebsiella pneumoniae]